MTANQEICATQLLIVREMKLGSPMLWSFHVSLPFWQSCSTCCQLFCHRCRLFSNAYDKFYCYSFWGGEIVSNTVTKRCGQMTRQPEHMSLSERFRKQHAEFAGFFFLVVFQTQAHLCFEAKPLWVCFGKVENFPLAITRTCTTLLSLPRKVLGAFAHNMLQINAQKMHCLCLCSCCLSRN